MLADEEDPQDSGGESGRRSLSTALDEKRLPKDLLPTSEQRTGFQVVRPSAPAAASLRGRHASATALDRCAVAGAEHRAIGALRRPVRAQERQTSRITGVLLIVGGLAVDYGGKAVQDAIAHPYLRPASAPVSMPGQRPVDHGLPDMPLMGGLIAFVLAHVFAHGMQLREDVEATI